MQLISINITHINKKVFGVAFSIFKSVKASKMFYDHGHGVVTKYHE